MKKLLIPFFIGLLGVSSLAARENLLEPDWTRTIGGTAIGTMTKESVSWRTDSVLSLNVRYKSSSTEPSAICSSAVSAPLARKYRFGASVNFSRSASWLTVRFTDGEGLVYSAITLSSDEGLQPGRWTRIELEADLTDITLPEKLIIELCPQWKGDGASVSDVFLPILISDGELVYSKADGSYPADILNCTFESWIKAADNGTRLPVGWKVSGGNVSQTAGSHVVDNAASLSAGATLTSPIPQMTDSVNLVFRALTAQPTTVSIAGVGVASLPAANRWTTVSLPVGSVPEGGFSFSSASDWVLDDVRLETAYSFSNPHPAEMEMTVTSSENDGAGSLREVIAAAPNYTRITFAVDKVELTRSINIGSKQLYFEGNEGLKIYAPEKDNAFSISPALENGLIAFRQIEFVGNASGPTNGGVFSASDSRATTRMHLSFDNVTFSDCSATGAGGAVYFNSPGLSADFSRCVFTRCQGGNGAAVAINNGVAFEFFRTVFTDCSSKSSVGGALAVNSTSTIKADVLGCAFENCVSSATSGGAGGIGLQANNSFINIGRTLFVGCDGGRGAAISAYNNTRGTISGRTAIVNCTAVNNTGTSPVISIAASGSYAVPEAWLVNNVVTSNSAKSLVSAKAPFGTNNLLDNCDLELQNPISHKPNQPSFLHYKDGAPAPDENNRYVYPIHTGGALYNAGTRSVITPNGDELVTDRLIALNSTDPTVLSLGHTEMNETNSAVKDIKDDSEIRLWPNPVSTTVFVEGEFDRVSLTDLGGTTVYVGNSSVVDVSSLTRGIYIVTIESANTIRTQKIIVK